jgi:heat-inducible transcriptional repressor
MPEHIDESVDERAQHLLKMLVERYIEEGVPVASKVLAGGVGVSSATVRNIMALLEAKGLVTSPHTSAGKVPTQRGFRFFVDTLISVQPLTHATVDQLRAELNPDLPPTSLVEHASRLLSHITHMAGLVTVPRLELSALRHVEFLSLSGQRVLVILVINEREVQNRIIHTEREYSESELQHAANFINQQYGGSSLAQVRAAVIDGMRVDKARMDQIMQTVLDVATKAFEQDVAEDSDYVVAGEANLLDAADDRGLETLRQLFDAFNRKRDILHLLDRCLRTQGVQLFIGQESGYRVLDEYSVVSAPYSVEGEVVGVLGVVGPTRMAYQRVIPIVDATAKLLGAALTSGN